MLDLRSSLIRILRAYVLPSIHPTSVMRKNYCRKPVTSKKAIYLKDYEGKTTKRIEYDQYSQVNIISSQFVQSIFNYLLYKEKFWREFYALSINANCQNFKAARTRLSVVTKPFVFSFCIAVFGREHKLSVLSRPDNVKHKPLCCFKIKRGIIYDASRCQLQVCLPNSLVTYAISCLAILKITLMKP